MSARRPRGPSRRGQDAPNSPDAGITDDAASRGSLQGAGRGNIPGQSSTGVHGSATGQNSAIFWRIFRILQYLQTLLLN
jgi:hypothetical protein